MCLYAVGRPGDPQAWEQRRGLLSEAFSPAYHHAAAQAEVLKPCTEVQDAQQCCLLPSGSTVEAKAESEQTGNKEKGSIRH